jgi:hypothetical protein
MPEFAVTGKRMEKNDRRTVPANFIGDLGVVAAQALHKKRLEHRVERGAKLAPRPSGAEARILSGPVRHS